MDENEALRLVQWVNDDTMVTLDKDTVRRFVNFLVAQNDSSFFKAVLRFNYSNPNRELPQQIGFGSERELELARKLIREETRELFDAIDEKDYVKAVDGLCDLQYVVFNMAGALGMHHHSLYEKAFVEVHRSNMTKRFEDGTVRQREDGKILKPEHFQAPRIKELLHLLGWRE